MLKAVNFTKKDEINAMSSTPLQKVAGQMLEVLGAAITERPDETTGEVKKVGIIISKEVGALSTISGTALKSLDMIIDYMQELADSGDDTPVVVNVKASKSNSGRDFLTLEIV